VGVNFSAIIIVAGRVKRPYKPWLIYGAKLYHTFPRLSTYLL